MKVEAYVVNLDRAAVRRDVMTKELATAGLTANFLGAIDYSVVGDEYFRDRYASFGPWGVVPPQDKAISSSHRKIWEHFLSTEADIALIFEDDIFVAPELGTWLKDMSWWPEDADLVRLEAWRDPKMLHVMSIKRSHFAGRRIQRLYSRQPGAAGYFITREHAKRMVAVNPIRWVADAFLFNPYVSPTARQAKIYQIAPALVSQGNDPGQEQTKRTKDRSQSWITLVKQELQRGWAELRNIPHHLFRILSGEARLEKLAYSNTPEDPALKQQLKD